jgi:dihydroorotase
MKPIIISNTSIINEGTIKKGSVIIENGIIADILYERAVDSTQYKQMQFINGEGLYLIPGVIDDQVHFREPGLTHKADIFSESKAAAAGGVTSFMEMPNTNPQTINQIELNNKYQLGAEKSLVNYSFYIGATNDNLDEILKTDPKRVCGVKIFMGASTGNMLVDNLNTLEAIFKESPLLIATHCEDENTIKQNLKKITQEFGDEIPFKYHPVIRSHEACLKSSTLAVELATKHNSRLHILHVSTKDELNLFIHDANRNEKKITAEVCIHHLFFDDRDYDKRGAFIKWNPAVKSEQDKDALLKGLKQNYIDVVATDHAPHTLQEKANPYTSCPSGGPMVQHSLTTMLEFYHNGLMTLEQIVDKMCHAPADIFQIDRRGYIRIGYHADLVLLDLNSPWTVNKENIYYKCQWSPLEGYSFQSKVRTTLVNGKVVYDQGEINDNIRGKRLIFKR